jgi:hypothetical protein
MYPSKIIIILDLRIPELTRFIPSIDAKSIQNQILPNHEPAVFRNDKFNLMEKNIGLSIDRK